jgi:superfamily II DNA or RNA helicase
MKGYTGFGKGRYSAELIKRIVNGKKWLVLTPKIVLIDNFREDFIKWGGDLSKIEDIICYNSISKYEGSNLNIVCDEAHHCTDLVLGTLDSINSDFRIFLSATISREIIDRIETHFPVTLFSYSLSEAIKDGIAPVQDIRLIKVPLDEEKRNFQGKRKNIKFSAKAYYSFLSKKVDYWKIKYENEGQNWQNFKWMQAALERKNWMAEYKIPICKKLLAQLDDLDKRYICFVNSVKQAKELGGENAIHSQQSSRVNQELIRKYNNFETNRLFSKDILSEGINLELTEASVYLQLDGSESKTLQKTGRTSARSEFPIQYCLVIPNTQDEVYFNKNFKQFKQYITEYAL